MSIKLLIADDHEVVRTGIVSLVRGTEIEVVAQAKSGNEAIALLATTQPDLVLLDVRMPDGDGLAALARIKQEHAELPVLILSTYDNPTYVARAVALGASGYMLKGATRDELLAAIRTAAAGESVWSREDLRRVTGALAAPRLGEDMEVPLTKRESEVLRQMALGLTNKEIAQTLGISYETVKEHVQHILRKIGVSDRTQAAVWAPRPLPQGSPVPRSTDIRLVNATCETECLAYRTPIKFGGRVVTDALLAHVRVEVETHDGRRATGRGSMPLGNVWAWPSAAVSGETTLAAMTRLAEAATRAAAQYQGVGHPLEITHDLAHDLASLAEDICRESELPEPMPRLAQLVAASPLEAAIHDAYGRALEANAYDLLSADYVDRDLAAYLTPEFAGEYLDRYTLRTPKPRMPLYHLVGALDPLSEGEIAQRLDDGLPETLPEWIVADGLTHLKIKLNGDDLSWDVARVAAVEQVTEPAQRARGCPQWNYSLDFNERCANVDYVLDFLARLEEQAPLALARVHYIEQPTHRDLRANPENRMHRAAKIKPVVIDESLVDLDSLLLARELGYSGVALKACKGHSEALLMGAAAQKFGMFLCVQDLTCPGASFLHSASLAARIPTVAAIEGNGRQYCPAGNRGWAERFPTMFDITDGTVGTAALTGPGLGF